MATNPLPLPPPPSGRGEYSYELKLPPVPKVTGTPIPAAYTGGAGSVSTSPVPLTPPPAAFQLPKGELPLLRDESTIERIISGWDWFMATNPTGRQLTSLNDVKDRIQLVRIGVIGDQSCFYHSVCKALVSIYQNAKALMAWFEEEKKRRTELKLPEETISDRRLRERGASLPLPAYPFNRDTPLERARQLFADKFRRDIATWLLLPAVNPKTQQPYTTEEAKIRLNTTSAALETFMENGLARNPIQVTFSRFPPVPREFTYYKSDGSVHHKTMEVSWASDMVDRLYSYDKATSEEAMTELLSGAVRHDPTALSTTVAAEIKQLRETLGDEKFRTQETVTAIRAMAIEEVHFTDQKAVLAAIQKGVEITQTESKYTSFPSNLKFNLADVTRLRTEFVNRTLEFAPDVELVEGKEVSKPPERNKYFIHYSYVIQTGIDAGESIDQILTNLSMKEVIEYPDGTVIYTDPEAYISKPTDTERQRIRRKGLHTYRDFLVPYIQTLMMLVSTFKAIFDDMNSFDFTKYRKREIGGVAVFDIEGRTFDPTNPDAPQHFIDLLKFSINPIGTFHFYSDDERRAIALRDPRAHLIEEKSVLDLPINLNYFMVNDGANIINYNKFVVEGGKDEYGYRLPTMLRYVLPRLSGDRKNLVRRDAGVSDIITLMPQIVGVNIYIVRAYGDHIDVEHQFLLPNHRAYPSIVINWLGAHFEIIGTWEDGAVKTVFEPERTLPQGELSFIEALREYFVRRVAAGGPKNMYKTLAVSKVPERCGGGSIYGPPATSISSIVCPIPTKEQSVEEALIASLMEQGLTREAAEEEVGKTFVPSPTSGGIIPLPAKPSERKGARPSARGAPSARGRGAPSVRGRVPRVVGAISAEEQMRQAMIESLVGVGYTPEDAAVVVAAQRQPSPIRREEPLPELPPLPPLPPLPQQLGEQKSRSEQPKVSGRLPPRPSTSRGRR